MCTLCSSVRSADWSKLRIDYCTVVRAKGVSKLLMRTWECDAESKPAYNLLENTHALSQSGKQSRTQVLSSLEFVCLVWRSVSVSLLLYSGGLFHG